MWSTCFSLLASFFCEYLKGFQVQRRVFTSACSLSNGAPLEGTFALSSSRIVDESRRFAARHYESSSRWRWTTGSLRERPAVEEERNVNALRSIADRCLDGDRSCHGAPPRLHKVYTHNVKCEPLICILILLLRRGHTDAMQCRRGDTICSPKKFHIHPAPLELRPSISISNVIK